jgi:hypothetical protein
MTSKTSLNRRQEVIFFFLIFNFLLGQKLIHFTFRLSVDFNVIKKNLKDMKTTISNLELDLKNLKRSAGVNNQNANNSDKYLEHMDAFYNEAQARYETLECMFSKMNEAYAYLAEFYAFDQNKYLLGEFFNDLKNFCAQFVQCGEENRKAKELEEKIRRCEEERIQRELEKQAKKTQKERLMQTATTAVVASGAEIGSRGDRNSDMGVMDNLLEALQSGKLFEASVPGSGGRSRGPRPVARRDPNNMMSEFYLWLCEPVPQLSNNQKTSTSL